MAVAELPRLATMRRRNCSGLQKGLLSGVFLARLMREMNITI